MNAEATQRSRSLRRYGDVLRIPALRPALVTALIGRLPVGMSGLAIVLLIKQQTDSYAVAGAVAAAYAISAGLIAPLMGRLIDRHGIPKVVVPLSVAQPFAIAALIVSARAGWADALLVACGVAIGLASPPLFAAIQSLLNSLAEPRGLMQAAFALEAVLQEFVFLGGPLLVALLVAAGSPTLALASSGLLTLAGGVSFSSTAAAREFRAAASEHRRLIGALSSPGIRTFALAAMASGVVFGILEVAMPAFAGEHGSDSVGGLLLAALATGSAIGGVWHGSRPHEGSLPSRYVAYLGLIALTLLPLALAGSVAMMLPLALVAGFFIAPSFATELALVAGLAPPGKVTEAFTWLSMAVVVGVALGNAICGALVEELGVSIVFVVASGAAATAAAIAFARRRTLVAGPDNGGTPSPSTP